MSNKKLFELGLVITITIIALVLRIYKLPDVLSYTFDQGRDLIAVSQIAQGDIKLLGPVTGGLGGLFLGPFYFYFLLPGFLLSGGSPVGTTIWLTLCYSLSLPLAYYILKPLVGKRMAVFGFGLLAICPGSIIEARLMWNPSLAVPTLLLSWFFLFQSKKKPLFLALSLFFFGLTMQTELAYALLIWPVYLWWLVVHSPISSKKVYSWLTLGISLVVAASTLIPQIVFELKNNFLLSRGVLSYLSESGESVSILDLWKIRPIQLADSIYTYLFGHVPGKETFFILLILAVSYAAFKIKTVQEKFLILIFIAPLTLSMLYGGGNGQFFPYYLSAHYLSVCLLLAVIINKLQNKVTQFSWLGVVSLIAVGSFAWSAKAFYFSEYQYTFKHQLRAYEKARQLAGEGQTIEVFTPNLRPVQYHYLNEWYSKTNNLPALAVNNNETGAKTVALLFEPPFAGGSLPLFRDWYKRLSDNKDCGPEHTFGLITIEQCRSLE